MIKLRVLLLSMIGLLSGCAISEHEQSKLDSWMHANGKVKVLSTTAMIDDLVGQIGKEHVDHTALIIGEIDPHSYELVKGDDEKLSYAGLLFCNGLGLEHGASLRYRIEQHPHAVLLGEVIQKKYPEKMLSADGQLDPHIWMDVSLWMEAVDPIVAALSEKDPSHTEEYLANGRALKAHMADVDQQIVQTLHRIPLERRFLVTSHDAFNYFTKRYLAAEDEIVSFEWKKRFIAPEGLAPDGQLSTTDIQKVIEHLCLHHIGTVFPESNVSKDSLRKIVAACKEKGLTVTVSQVELYGDAMGSAGTDGDCYLKMMVHNATTIEKGLQGDAL